MNNSFNSILTSRPRSNRFNLSHDVKTSFRMGCQVPILAEDLVPGDRFNMSFESLLRMSPMIAPVMHKVKVRITAFFVPNRLLWDEWEDFITGTDQSEPPYLSNNPTPDITEGSIADYLGLPIPLPAGVPFSAFPIAAYYLIWDEWFRDENLQDELFEPLVTGNNSSTYRIMAGAAPLKRAWPHDYFTSALPFAQKGDAVSLPLVDGPVDIVPAITGNAVGALDAVTGNNLGSATKDTLSALSGNVIATETATGDEDGVIFDPRGTLVVDLQGSSATINQLREAFRMQEFLELDAIGGTRYTETIYAHFGIRSKDARLQRPELIGSTTSNMVISEVLQTAPPTADQTTAATPLGTMGGHGISVAGGKGFNYTATEHGWIIAMINVQPIAAYQQGLARKWNRNIREDYFWPKFAHIGEQEILNKEIYVDAAEPDETFGYIPRYSEYRYSASRVSGEMRSSLSHWHMGRIFDSEPALNEDFISCDPTTRIFAVQYEGGTTPEFTADQIIAHIFINISASRLMPKYGRPML